MKKISLQIDLKQQRWIPAIIMGIYAFGISINFLVIDMTTALYVMLGTQLLSFIFAAFLIVRQSNITRTDAVYLGLLLIVALATLAAGTDIRNWTHVIMRTCIPLFMFNYYKNNTIPLIFGLTCGFSIAVVLQLYQLITQPEIWLIQDTREISSYLLGGNYNQMGGYLIVTIILNILCCSISRYYWVLAIPMIFLCTIIPILVGSMTASTSLVVLCLLCVIPWKRVQRFSIGALLLFVILFQILVCFQGNGIQNSETAVWFIEDILHKDITFTYRTHMWDSALKVILESPIWGHGFPDSEWYLSHMSAFAIGPHNCWLGILIYGGILGLVLYLYLLSHALFTVYPIGDRYSHALMASIVMISLMMLMEIYPVPLICLLFILAEYYPNLFEQNSIIKKGNE